MIMTMVGKIEIADPNCIKIFENMFKDNEDFHISGLSTDQEHGTYLIGIFKKQNKNMDEPNEQNIM